MKTLLDLEYAVHEALDAGEPVTVRNYAEFAAGEISTITVANLLEAICLMDHRQWQALLDRISGRLQQCMRDLATELERKRAAFMEHEALRIQAARENESVARSEQA